MQKQFIGEWIVLLTSDVGKIGHPYAEKNSLWPKAFLPSTKTKMYHRSRCKNIKC